jgi:membrane fusion protein (multidrug efflux system)
MTRKNRADQLLVSPEDTLTVERAGVRSGDHRLDPAERRPTCAPRWAVVLQVLKENGEPVKRGDVLVKLDETSIRDSLMSADEASAPPSRPWTRPAQLERLKTLRASGMTSAQALDDAEVRRNNAQSEVSAARARRWLGAPAGLTRTVVRAPFDGIVSDRKVSAGDTAAIGKELLKVIDPTSMRFEGRCRPTRSPRSRSASRCCSASTATATRSSPARSSASIRPPTT